MHSHRCPECHQDKECVGRCAVNVYGEGEPRECGCDLFADLFGEELCAEQDALKEND